MKKIFVLIILLSILILNALQTNDEFSFSKYFSFGDLTIYSRSTSSDFLPNVDINGNGKVIGESIKFTNVEPVAIIQTLKANICFYEYIAQQDLTIFYCYSPLIKKNVFIKEHEINLQLATCENYTIVGWPLILGNF